MVEAVETKCQAISDLAILVTTNNSDYHHENSGDADNIRSRAPALPHLLINRSSYKLISWQIPIAVTPRGRARDLEKRTGSLGRIGSIRERRLLLATASAVLCLGCHARILHSMAHKRTTTFTTMIERCDAMRKLRDPILHSYRF